MTSSQTTQLHPPPPKPIYKHPLKPTTTKNPLKPAITPAPPPKTRQGDPQWLRIMQTKENQWRLINTIALQELNLLERSACKQLDSLAARLDSLITQTANLDNLVTKCRSIRARETFHKVAAPPLRRAITILQQLQYHDRVACIPENRSAIDVRAHNFEDELVRFRQAANQFADVARFYHVHELADVADELRLLAEVAGREPAAVACAAQAVVDAAHASERARLDIVDAITENHAKAFVPEPSFVEPSFVE